MVHYSIMKQSWDNAKCSLGGGVGQAGKIREKGGYFRIVVDQMLTKADQWTPDSQVPINYSKGCIIIIMKPG